MLPLVGDLAPPHRRSTALSIVVSGMLLGMLIARLLSGVVTEFIGWRYIYWIAFGLQLLILVLLFLFMPDYPSTNPDMGLIQKYPSLLFDILRMPFKYPVLVQACLIGFFTASIFTSYWTTLTFLLAGSPYHYSSLVIGLFALVGIGSMTWGPIFARTVMEKHEPLFSILIGETICLAGVIIGTYTGLHAVAGPIIQAACIDIGLQTSQIANRIAIFGVEPKGRNRVNTAYMVSVFSGQLMGTAVGNHLYAQGGWVWSGSASVGFVCAALVVCFSRGPHEQGWVGWAGGCKMQKPKVVKQAQKDEEKGVMDDQAPKPFTSGQADAEDLGDNKDVVVNLRTSDHFVSGNASDKTLTISEDDSSTRDARNVTKDNAE
jgi:predicted MFS family arabinose efflux permease